MYALSFLFEHTLLLLIICDIIFHITIIVLELTIRDGIMEIHCQISLQMCYSCLYSPYIVFFLNLLYERNLNGMSAVYTLLRRYYSTITILPDRLVYLDGRIRMKQNGRRDELQNRTGGSGEGTSS